MKSVIESLREDLAALQEAGAVSHEAVREFDALWPPKEIPNPENKQRP